MKKAILLLVVLATCGYPVKATPYASDDFSSYSIGSNPAGQNGGAGFGGAWSLSTYDGGTGSATIVPGLILTGVDTSGNAVQITGGGGGGATLNRTFGTTMPTNGNLWGSFVFSQQTLINNNGYGQDATATGTKFTLAGDSNRQYFANPLDDSPYSSSNYADMGIYKNSNASGIYPTLNLDQTYFVVFDFQNIGYGAYSPYTTTENLWVLDQTDLTALGGYFTPASLNAHNVLDLSYNSGPGGETFGTSQINAGAVFSLLGQAGTVDFGDVKLGSALSDVAAPEPSTWALMIAGFVGLVIIRRKRSSAH